MKSVSVWIIDHWVFVARSSTDVANRIAYRYHSQGWKVRVK